MSKEVAYSLCDLHGIAAGQGDQDLQINIRPDPLGDTPQEGAMIDPTRYGEGTEDVGMPAPSNSNPMSNVALDFIIALEPASKFRASPKRLSGYGLRHYGGTLHRSSVPGAWMQRPSWRYNPTYGARSVVPSRISAPVMPFRSPARAMELRLGVPEGTLGLGHRITDLSQQIAFRRPYRLSRRRNSNEPS